MLVAVCGVKFRTEFATGGCAEQRREEICRKVLGKIGLPFLGFRN